MRSTAPADASSPEAPAYRWVVLVACAALIGLVSVAWHSFSLFLVALVGDFGWARAEVSLGFSIFVLCNGLTGPNAGHLIGRFGASRVVIAGGLLLALGLALTSRVTTLWQFYLCFGVISAIGFSASGWIAVVTLLQSWFRRNLGAAIGIASAGVGIGIMLLIPATQAAISAYGWRATYLGMAVCALIVVLPLGLVLREGPLGRLRPSSAAAGAGDDPSVVDRLWVSRAWTLSMALRTRRYWFLLGGFFLASFASNQLMAHHVAYLRAAGVAALAAAAIVGIVGLASVPAKITWGVLSDRIGREATYSLGIALVVAAIVALWLVPAVDAVWLPYLYACLIGAGYAVSATMPPIITADLFRGAGYAAIFGGISLATSTGSGIGTWLAGFIFDRTGSYHLAFVIAAVGTSAGALCLWLAAPRKVRRAPGQLPHRVAEPAPPVGART